MDIFDLVQDGGEQWRIVEIWPKEEDDNDDDESLEWPFIPTADESAARNQLTEMEESYGKWGRTYRLEKRTVSPWEAV